MEKIKNIPSLRFPEFNGEWENKKLGEVAEKRIVKNKENKIKNVFTNSAIQGIVNQRDFFDKDIANQNNLLGYYVVEHNDFIYNPRISNYAPVGPISRNNLQSGIMSPLYSVFRFNFGNVDFVEYYFNTTKWHKHMEDIANYGARDDRMSFSTGDFYKMPILFPNIKEQNNIASFLTVVDEKLKALKQKKTLLDQYKKGIMKQIFSQEIRFKDDNENDYPDWEEKKLGDIGETYNGLTGKTKENFGNGKPYIQYKQIFDNSKIDISRFELVEIGPTEKQNKVLFGDVFFTVSSETPNEIGMSSVLLDEIEELYLNSFCFGYRANSLTTLSPYFSKYLFRCEIIRNQIIKLAQGSTRFNMSKVQLMKLMIYLPNLDEQTKIANFLSVIDEKIKHCQEQITNTEVWKKGLLQQMFC